MAACRLAKWQWARLNSIVIAVIFLLSSVVFKILHNKLHWLSNRYIVHIQHTIFLFSSVVFKILHNKLHWLSNRYILST